MFSFWKNHQTISTAAPPFYISTSNGWGFQFLHAKGNACYSPHPFFFVRFFSFFLFFVYSYLERVKWYLTVVFIYISLMINDAGHLSSAYSPFGDVLWRNVYSSPLPIFKLGCLPFCCLNYLPFKGWFSKFVLVNIYHRRDIFRLLRFCICHLFW